MRQTTQARSSVVEHYLDMVVVGGSIPLAPTRVKEALNNSIQEFSAHVKQKL